MMGGTCAPRRFKPARLASHRPGDGWSAGSTFAATGADYFRFALAFAAAFARFSFTRSFTIRLIAPYGIGWSK
jgi:hypothetical protein